jgi:soluble lytic murein transglycosylase-like protein
MEGIRRLEMLVHRNPAGVIERITAGELRWHCAAWRAHLHACRKLTFWPLSSL